MRTDTGSAVQNIIAHNHSSIFWERGRNAAVFSTPAARQHRDLWNLVVWAVKHQRAADDDIALHDVEMQAFARAQGYEPHSSTSDGTATLSRRGALGCAVDGGIVRGVAPRVHPDAQGIADAIARLSGRDRGAILRAARAGEPPAWICPASQRLCPLPAGSGAGRGNKFKVVGEFTDTPHRSEIARQRIARGEPILDRHGRSLLEREEKGFTFRTLDGGARQVLTKWCPVVPSPSAEFILSTNAAYSAWNAAMVRLLAELRRVELRDHLCTGFDAPATPWDDAE